LHNAAVADPNLWTNNTVSADFHIPPNLRVLIDDRARVNAHNTPASLKLKYGARPSAGAPMMM
jgi:hypothetical protein